MHKQIQINQLLMEREDRLVEVFELERQIGIVLGGASYPLELPVDLPSCKKRKKGKRKKSRSAKTTAVRLRKLEPGSEAAYRITYCEDDVEKIEIHTDVRPLTLLVNTPLPQLQVLSIETVQAAENNEWTSVETLFSTEQEESG